MKAADYWTARFGGTDEAVRIIQKDARANLLAAIHSFLKQLHSDYSDPIHFNSTRRLIRISGWKNRPLQKHIP